VLGAFAITLRLHQQHGRQTAAQALSE